MEPEAHTHAGWEQPKAAGVAHVASDPSAAVWACLFGGSLPDRVIRGELLESDRWLDLKDNADRSAWVAASLSVDNFGDMPASRQRLCRLWRPYGIDTVEKVGQTFSNLSDVDLIRGYEVEGKLYLHIPRFGQRLRWVGHAWPLSPWATIKEKQAFSKKYPADHGVPPAEVEVKRREEKRIRTILSDSPAANTDEARQVLEFLNRQTSRAYRPTANTLKPILARLKEGYTMVECKAVILRRKAAWWADDKMRPYLRPETLFNATKFAQYVGEVAMDQGASQ